MSKHRTRFATRTRAKFLAGLAALLASSPAFADEFHYNNILIGERASGMGGAYYAISDDPTGIFYNPAGMVYGFENYISVSANTLSSSETKFKNIVKGFDYTLKSSALIPSFFGFSQSLGKSKIGLAIVVPDSQLLNQDDKLVGLYSGTNQPNTLYRRFFREDTTYMIGPGFSSSLGEKASWGISLLGMFRTDTQLDHQFLQYNPLPTGVYLLQDTEIKQTIFGLYPKFGVQFMPTPKLSMGVTVAKKFTVSSSFFKRITRSKTDPNTGAPVTPTGSFDNDYEITTDSSYKSRFLEPLTIGAGAAFFASKTLLFTGDLTYYGDDPNYKDFKTASVINGAVGTEWFASDWLALRLGVFTDRANTPAVAKNKSGQSPHVDMIGVGTGVSLLKPGSSFSIGVRYSTGSGSGQAIGGTATDIQDVTQNNLGFYLAGGYQL